MAKVDVIIHGVPFGHQVSKCDKNLKDFFGYFYDNSKGVKTHAVRRNNNDVVYSYLVYADGNKSFCDYNGRTGSYFGISVICHNQYIPNSEQVFKLLQAIYNNYVKNKIIREFPNGNRKWMYGHIDTPGDEIAAYICRGMSYILSTHPELMPKVQTLPPLTNQNQRR